MRGYSLGMRQRLGLAGVLLGDPHTVILDEPANGLDPEGIRWIRDVLVHLARQGRTVLVSSHLLSEIALMADDLVVIGRGRLIEQGPVSQFIDRHATRWVRVRTPRPAAFAERAAAGRRRRTSRPGPTASTSAACRSSRSASWRRASAPCSTSCRRRARRWRTRSCRPRPTPRSTAAGRTARRRRRRRTRAAAASAGRRIVPGAGSGDVIDAIRSEWIKLSTITVTWVLALLAVLSRSSSPC